VLPKPPRSLTKKQGPVRTPVSVSWTPIDQSHGVSTSIVHPRRRAAMLHLPGVDHKRLAEKFQGLEIRFTGSSGDVVKDIPA
jgi:hypothetical protein